MAGGIEQHTVGQEISKVRRVALVSLDSDDTFREKRAWLMSDNTVRHAGKTYLYSRAALKYVDTTPAKLKLSNGKKPALFVFEERAQPVLFSSDGYKHDSSYALDQFKRMTLTSQLVRAAQKENPVDFMKYLIVAGLGLLIVVILFLVWIAHSLGIFSQGFLPSGGG